jgi:hypothetical protein
MQIYYTDCRKKTALCPLTPPLPHSGTAPSVCVCVCVRAHARAYFLSEHFQYRERGGRGKGVRWMAIKGEKEIERQRNGGEEDARFHEVSTRAAPRPLVALVRRFSRSLQN